MFLGGRFCNHRIQRFDISEHLPDSSIFGDKGSNGEFFYPYDLAIASDGSVVVIEYKIIDFNVSPVAENG